MRREIAIILIIPSLLCTCKEKDDSENVQKPIKTTDTFFSGRVIDQVSKLPVVNANVILGAYPYTLIWAGISNYWGIKCLSDEKGNYKLTVKKEIISWENLHYIEYTPCIYATKPGYAGSSYIDLAESQKKDIEMYHPTTLKLRVWNDTVSNTKDDFNFAIIGANWNLYPGFVGRVDRYGFYRDRYTCTGRKYDSIFVWTSLWGNLKYSIRDISKNSRVDTSFVLKPDSIVSFSISF